MEDKYNTILKFSPYKEKIYEDLKNAIIKNVFKPNEVLNERKIAERLGISRTPVRDAIKLLEFEGWVNTIPWKGTYVSDLQKKDVKEVIQLRRALECLAIELIENILEEDVNNLNAILDRMTEYAKNNELDKYMIEDRMFHLYLANLSGNSRLIQIFSNLSDHIYRLGIRAILLEGRTLQSTEEHMLILNALAIGDIETAKKYVTYHLENTEKAINEVLDKQREARKD